MATTATNYLKNVMKSVAYAAADVSDEYVPSIKEFAEANKEFGVATYAAIKNPPQFVKKQVQALQDSKVYKALDYGVRNLSEDLRTGNFYNKARKERDELALSGLDSNWDDLSEFGIDNDWEKNLDNSSSSKNDEVTAGDMKIVESIEGSNAALASATVNAVISSSNYEVKSNRANTAMIYSQNERLFGGLHKDMTVLGSTMQQMYKLQSASLQNIDKNMSEYFTQESKLSAERNAILKEMLDLQRNYYKSASDKERDAASKKTSTRIRWGDINSNGVINFDAYFKAVRKNISDQVSSLMPASFGEDGNMLAVMMTSPLEGAMKYVVNGVIPATVKMAAKQLNDSFSGIFGTAIGRLGNARSNNDDSILGMIAKFLGVSTNVNRNIDTSRYEKGPVPFDGITRKAIIDVIPTHLRRIEAALTGNPEEMFDYKAGRWIRVATAKKQFDDIKESYINRGTSSIRQVMNPGVKLQRNSLEKNERDDFDKAIKEFWEYYYDHNGDFNPYVSAQKNGISSGTALYRNYNKIVAIYKTSTPKVTSKDSKGNTITRENRSVFLRATGEALDTKEAEERFRRQIESEPGSIYHAVAGMPKNYDIHGKWDKSKTKFEPYNILKDAKDNLGNTVFDYLASMTADLTWIRENGGSLGTEPGGESTNKTGIGKTIEAIRRDLDKNYKSRMNKAEKERNEEKNIRKQVLDNIASGKAIDLRDFSDDEMGELLAMSEAMKKNNIEAYKDEFEGYNQSDLSKFMNKHLWKTKISSMDDVKKAIEKAEKENKNTNEVMDAKEEKFFDKIMKRIGMGGNLFSGIAGATADSFTNLLYAADRAIYEMMFKAEINDDTVKKTYNGFMDMMADKLNSTFESVKDKFKEIFDPFLGKFGINKDFKENFKKSLTDQGAKIWGAFKDANADVYGPAWNKVKEEANNKINRVHKKAVLKGFKNSDTATSNITNANFSKAINNGTKEWDSYSEEAGEARRVRALAIRQGGEALSIWCERNGFTGSLDEKKVRLDSEFGLPSSALANIKTHEDANMVFAKQFKHNAKGTTGSPFTGLTTLTKGEGLINGSGFGTVPKTGVYNITDPTHIINTEDMYALTGEGTNVSVQTALGREKLAAKNAGYNVASHAGGSLKITNNNVNISSEDVISEAKKYIPEAASGGLIGAIVSMVLGLVGGPLAGAAIGAGGSIIASSDKLKAKLFGKSGEDGKNDGSGLISKTVMDSFNKYFPDMAKYGMAGIIPGLLTPLGPLGGLLVGGAFGYLKNNEKFTNKYFGENGKLTIKSEEKKILEKLIPGAAKGAAAGAIATLLVPTPFGIMGNAVLGAGLGMMTTTDEFKNLILGEEINGERFGGLLGALKDAIEPFTSKLHDAGINLTNAFDENIINPIAKLIRPAIHALPIALGTLPKALGGFLHDKIGNKIGLNSDSRLGRAAAKVSGMAGGLVSGAASVTGKVLGVPGYFLNKAGDSLTAYDIRHGDFINKTQAEAVEWMDNHGRGREVSKLLRATSMIGSGEEGSINKDDAEVIRDYLNKMNDTEASAKQGLRKANNNLNKLLRSKTFDGKKLSDDQIDGILKAAENRDYDKISQLLQKRTLKGSKEGLTEAQYNDFMDGEGGLKEAIENAVSWETRLANTKKKIDLTPEQEEMFKSLGIDINDRKSRAKAAALISDQLTHLDANPEEVKINEENNENLKDLATTVKSIFEIMTARATGGAEAERAAAEAALQKSQDNTNAQYTSNRNAVTQSMGDSAKNLSESALDKISVQQNKWMEGLPDTIFNNVTGNIDIIKKAFDDANIRDLANQFDADAIQLLSSCKDSRAKIIIDGLKNKFINKALKYGGYQITKETINLLSDSVTIKELSNQCTFLSQIHEKSALGKNIYGNYKSLEQIHSNLTESEMSKLRKQYGIKYHDSTGFKGADTKRFLGTAKRVAGKVLGTAAKVGIGAGAAAALGLPGAAIAVPYLGYKGIKGVKNIIANKMAGVGDEPVVEQNGLGTMLLGMAGKAGKWALGKAGSAVKSLAGKAVSGAKSLFSEKDDESEGKAGGLLPNLFGGMFGGDNRPGIVGDTSEIDKEGDGREVLPLGDGYGHFRRDSSGNIEPDTSDSHTKDLLNKMAEKEKSAKAAQEAQIEMAETIKKTYDTSDITESKGGKLGWLSLILTTGYLWKTGIIQKVFNGVIKPLWSDHLKPWITDTAVPWLTGTALPAIGKVLTEVLGTVVVAFAKDLPSILKSSILGVGDLALTALDALTGNKTNVGGTTIVNANEIAEEKGLDYETGMTDENGNKLTAEDLTNGNYENVYNADGVEMVDNGDGTFTAKDQSKKGSSAAPVIAKLGIRSGVKIFNDVVKTGMKETGGEFASLITSDAVKKAVTDNSVTKAVKLIGDALDKLFSNKLVYKWLKKLAKLIGQSKPAQWINSFKEKVQEIFGKAVDKCVNKVGATTLQTIGKVLAWAQVISDFLIGCDTAESILGVTEVTPLEAVVAGLLKAIFGLVPILSICSDWITKFIVESIYKLMGKDISERQAEATAEYEEYKATTGSTLSQEEYLESQYSLKGKVTNSIKTWWNKATGKTSKEEDTVTDEDITDTETTTTTTTDVSSTDYAYGTGKFGRSKYSKQIDPAVARMRFNAAGDSEYQTIGDSGCGPAAAVNALEAMYGRGNSVASAAKFALNRGYKETDGGTKPGFFADYFNSNGYGSSTSYNKSQIASNIMSGMPTVLMGKDARGTSSRTPFGTTPHYVTVTGTDGRGNAIVQDPESRYDNQLYPLKGLMKNTSLGVSAFGKRSKFGRGRWGRGDDVAAQIWWYLKKVGMTDAGAAGLMGNLHAESGLHPDRLQGDIPYSNKSVEYTAAVDSGAVSKDDFINNGPGGGGYGLAQWTSPGRKQGLYELAREQRNVSISDLATQLEWLVKELSSNSFKDVLTVLMNTNDLAEASDIVLTKFEKPKNAESYKSKRRENGQSYYNTFAGSQGQEITGTTAPLELTSEYYDSNYTSSSTSSNVSSATTTGNTVFSKLFNTFTSGIADIASQLFGTTSSSSSTTTSSGSYNDYSTTGDYTSYSDNSVIGSGDAASIVDIARGEVGTAETGINNVKYNDWFYGRNVSGNDYPWCAAFTSWVANKAGVSTDIIPKTASTRTSYSELVKRGGQVSTSEARPGDYIFFSDTGNAANIHHTGIVTGNTNGVISTVEGNSSDMVAERTYDVNNYKVLVARPQYANTGEVEDYNSSAEVGDIADWANTRGGNGVKPLSKYGQFRNSIYGHGAGKKMTLKSKEGSVKIEDTAMVNESSAKGTGRGRARYGMAGATDYSNLINTIITILMTIADNTDKLNTIITILNDKLGVNITASDVSNATSDTQSLKSQLSTILNGSSGISKFNTYADAIGDTSINTIVSAMNALASE